MKSTKEHREFPRSSSRHPAVTLKKETFCLFYFIFIHVIEKRRKNTKYVSQYCFLYCCKVYEGHSEVIEVFLFPKEKERFIHQLEIQMISRCSLWGFNPSLDRLNKDWKKGKESTFTRNLNVALPPSSTSLQVKTAIPCVLSLNFEKREE